MGSAGSPPPRLGGRLVPPGDKSLSHRALIFAALAEGESRLTHLNRGADIRSTERVLRALGVSIRRRGEVTVVQGVGGQFRAPRGTLDCGNSGTTMRLMSGILAACPFSSRLTGDASLRRRPMARIALPLQQMGAVVKGRSARTGGEVFAPLAIQGAKLRSVRVVSPVASAQVKSAILFAGHMAGVPVRIHEPELSRDHTERMMRALGGNVRRSGGDVVLGPSRGLKPVRGRIPGDPSAVAFLAAAAAALPDSKLTVEGVLLNPTRLGFFRILRKMGAQVDVQPEGVWCGESFGSIVITAGELRGIRLGAREIPALVDEIPLVGILGATACNGWTHVRGAGELRTKESDRISALVEGLLELGSDIREVQDGFSVRGGELSPGKVDAYGDHRIAMAFRIAGLLSGKRIQVKGSAVSRVSYPGFSADVKRVLKRGRP